MTEIKEKKTFINPYVVQMDKFADSLVHLSKTFLTLEDYKGTFSKEEIEEMFLKVTDKVCDNCEKKEWCLGENRVHTYQLLYEILCTVEEFGAELNVELKRSLQKRCIKAPRFLRETLETFENAKNIMMWNNKIVQNREGYAEQLDRFAKMIQHTTRELDAGIFEDEHLEKRLKTQLKKGGETGPVTFTIPNIVPTREGYRFLYWTDSTSALVIPDESQYKPGDKVELKNGWKSMELFARWEEAVPDAPKRGDG